METCTDPPLYFDGGWLAAIKVFGKKVKRQREREKVLVLKTDKVGIVEGQTEEEEKGTNTN
jgi:hypothetical protein